MSLLAAPRCSRIAAALAGAALLLGAASSAFAALTVEVLHAFTAHPAAPAPLLVLGNDGALYGATREGGTFGSGTLFKVDADGTFTLLHSFGGTGELPPLPSVLERGGDGGVYGVTLQGPGNYTLFKFDAGGTFSTLHSFDGRPSDALALGSDGALYGCTLSGGSFNFGTLFKIDAGGTFTSLRSFNNTEGACESELTLGGDGALYGSTRGGSSNGGTLFKVDAGGTFTHLHTLSRSIDGRYPSALALGSDGALYGSAREGGGLGYGTLFKITAGGTFTPLRSFNRTVDGRNPGALTVGSDGMLYGSTQSGGSFGDGTLFKISGGGTFTLLHNFNAGEDLQSRLVAGSDGALYGSATRGSSGGTLFRIDASGTFSTLHNFDPSLDGYFPGSLTLGGDGALYGTAAEGGLGSRGTLFKIDVGGTFTSLHRFQWLEDGAYPDAALALGTDGALYGSTSLSGSHNAGTLFKIDAGAMFTSLHSFDPVVDGRHPQKSLTLGSDGALYGPAQEGGTYSAGTLFKIDAAGVFASLHSFGSPNGLTNPSALELGSDGALYGTTEYGGTFNSGSLFRIDEEGSFTSLYSFAETTIAGGPQSALALGSDGALYGSTRRGGSGYGTLFKIDTAGTFTLLHTFDDDFVDGYSPRSELVLGSDGALYGTTEYGGSFNSGSLFKIDEEGTYASLYSFDPSLDGSFPRFPLTLGGDGALYGFTSEGGPFDSGTLFKIDAGGTFTSLHSFDGAKPETALTLGSDGALYGSTFAGGDFGWGTLFRIDTDGTFTSLHSFDPVVDGYNLDTPLALGSDGALYGTSGLGGPKGGGVVFRLGEPTPSACSNGLDDDGDGLIDHPADPGCADLADRDEHEPTLICDDGIDNDGDGLTDHALDPGCKSALATRESARCQDGLDNDGDGKIDFDGGATANGGSPLGAPDPACNGKPWLDTEASGCGLGAELAGTLVLLNRLRRRGHAASLRRQ